MLPPSFLANSSNTHREQESLYQQHPVPNKLLPPGHRKSQVIHHHIPKMQVLHPVTSMHSITYRWTTTGHPEKKEQERDYAQVTKSEGSPGKKASQSSLLSLLVYSHNMFRHMLTWMSFLGIWRSWWLGITSMDLPRLNHAWPVRLPSVIK